METVTVASAALKIATTFATPVPASKSLARLKFAFAPNVFVLSPFTGVKAPVASFTTTILPVPVPMTQLNLSEVRVPGTGSKVIAVACWAWLNHEIKNREAKRVKILFIDIVLKSKKAFKTKYNFECLD